MRIAILDDVSHDREYLQTLILQYFETKKTEVTVSMFANSQELLSSSKTYAIVFLDIYMDDMNGMKVAHNLREIGYAGDVVFVTSSKDHAIEGYKVKASGYLVKPFAYEQLAEILDLCALNWDKKKEYIEIKEGRVMVKVRLKDILYSDYYNHYIQIHTKQHMYRTYLSFADFSSMLAAYPNFLSCYRNVLVNLEYVASMDTKDFLMKDGCRIPIAKIKRQEVRQAYADYLFHQLSEQ